jgi:hypothetical protein
MAARHRLTIALTATCGVLLALLLATGAVLGPFHASSDTPAAVRAPDTHAIAVNQAGVPLHFEPNEGQADAAVQYLARGAGYTLFLTPGEAVLSLRPPSERPAGRPGAPAPAVAQDAAGSASAARGQDMADGGPDQSAALSPRPAVVRMQLVGADAGAAAEARDALPGKMHYYSGNDPARWRTNVPTYARVQYRDVYPGIDLVYYGNQGQVEYDFVVAPGADPSAIRLAFSGAASLEVDAAGDLLLETPAGAMRQRKPLVYQEGAAGRQEVPGDYHLADDGQVRFALGPYDARRPLVIDPVLTYGTYLGGTAYDVGAAIAVDSQGNAYVTGETSTTGSGPDFPTGGTSCATPPCFIGPATGAQRWAFVTKLNAGGTGLVYSALIGGGQNQGLDSTTIGYGIAVDAQGQAYLTGYTDSPTFPTTPGAYAPTYPGQTAAFLTKLNAVGNGLLYSTYLGGGGGFDVGYAIAIDASGNAYVTGRADSPFFPFTIGALTPPGGGGTGAFVSKVNTNGSGGASLVYSTRIGPSGNLSIGYGITVDGQGRAYVTGWTQSAGFPTTPGALSTTFGGVQDAFVLKLNPDVAVQPPSNQLLYSTYLGGTTSPSVGQGTDSAWAIAMEPGCPSNCNVYVTGETLSSDFPTTAGAFRRAFSGCCVAFVAKLTPNTAIQPPINQLLYSTFLGGSSPTFDESGQAIAVDAAGQAHVTGYTYSTDFPLKDGMLSQGVPARPDVFVTKLNAAGSALVYSTGLGTLHGTFIVSGNGIALDSAGNAYVAGQATCCLLTSPGAFDPNPHGGFLDAFVVKLNPASPTPTVTGTPTSTPTATATPMACQVRPPVTVAVTPASGGRLQVVVTAGTASGNASNRIQSIQFAATSGALLDTPNGPTVVTGSTGPLTQTFSPGVASYTFFLRQQSPSGAATAPFTVTDACGTWPTFAGGGPAVFGGGPEPGAPAPTATATPRPPGSAAPATPTPFPAGSAAAASPTPTVGVVACAPRPALSVSTAPEGAGRLRVTVAASGANNTLGALRFGIATNARIEASGQSGTGNFSVALPAGTAQTSFLLSRISPGQAATANLTVVDGCGDWSTIVGGGASAF